MEGTALLIRNILLLTLTAFGAGGAVAAGALLALMTAPRPEAPVATGAISVNWVVEATAPAEPLCPPTLRPTWKVEDTPARAI